MLAFATSRETHRSVLGPLNSCFPDHGLCLARKQRKQRLLHRQFGGVFWTGATPTPTRGRFAKRISGRRSGVAVPSTEPASPASALTSGPGEPHTEPAHPDPEPHTQCRAP